MWIHFTPVSVSVNKIKGKEQAQHIVYLTNYILYSHTKKNTHTMYEKPLGITSVMNQSSPHPMLTKAHKGPVYTRIQSGLNPTQFHTPAVNSPSHANLPKRIKLNLGSISGWQGFNCETPKLVLQLCIYYIYLEKVRGG